MAQQFEIQAPGIAPDHRGGHREGDVFVALDRLGRFVVDDEFGQTWAELGELSWERPGRMVEVYSHLSRQRSQIAAARIDGLLKRGQAPDEAAI